MITQPDQWQTRVASYRKDIISTSCDITRCWGQLQVAVLQEPPNSSCSRAMQNHAGCLAPSTRHDDLMMLLPLSAHHVPAD